MKTQLMKLTMVALTGLAFLTPSAKATVYFSGNTTYGGDLVLGFQATGGTSATSDYIVDLGSWTQFASGGAYATTGTTILNVTVPGLAADLSATFGSDWYSNTTTGLEFGIAGVQGITLTGNASANTLFISRAETSNGNQTLAPLRNTNSQQATVVGPISTMAGVLNTGTNSSNNPSAQVQSSASTNSWDSYMGTNAFNYGNFGSIEAVISSTSSNVIDLYELVPQAGGTHTGGTFLGAFQLSSNGTLMFSSNANNFSSVPEPSTYALFGGGLIALVLLRRAYRKKDQVTA